MLLINMDAKKIFENGEISIWIFDGGVALTTGDKVLYFDTSNMDDIFHFIILMKKNNIEERERFNILKEILK